MVEEKEIKNKLPEVAPEESKPESSSRATPASGGKGVLAIVVVVVLIAAGSLGYLYLRKEQVSEPDETVLSVIAKDGTVTNFTWDEIKGLASAEGPSQYQNKVGIWKDEGTYKGAKMSAIIDAVGGISSSDIVNVTADGYYYKFNYHHVYPNQTWLDIQGNMILAYSFNGTEYPDWEDAFKVAFLPSDGGYSNDDATATTPAGEAAPSSGGSRWVRNIISIKIEIE